MSIQVRLFAFLFADVLGFGKIMSEASTTERQVLPTNVKPVHYDLTLKPNLETFVFYGRVKVE